MRFRGLEHAKSCPGRQSARQRPFSRKRGQTPCRDPKRHRARAKGVKQKARVCSFSRFPFPPSRLRRRVLTGRPPRHPRGVGAHGATTSRKIAEVQRSAPRANGHGSEALDVRLRAPITISKWTRADARKGASGETRQGELVTPTPQWLGCLSRSGGGPARERRRWRAVRKRWSHSMMRSTKGGAAPRGLSA